MPRKVRALQPFVAHGSGVNCLHVGPKSSGVLVTGGADRLVNVWRVGKPTAIMTLAGHNTPITSVRFNNTEESVNAGSQGGRWRHANEQYQRPTASGSSVCYVLRSKSHEFLEIILGFRVLNPPSQGLHRCIYAAAACPNTCIDTFNLTC